MESKIKRVSNMKNPLGQNLRELFQLCNQLREQFNLLELDAEEVEEIAMNASVASGHAGSRQKVCNELANLISKTARRMQHQTLQMRMEVNRLVTHTLRAYNLEKRLEKFSEAQELIRNLNNCNSLGKAISYNMSDVSSHMGKNLHYCSTIEALLRGQMVNQLRLFTTLNALKVEMIELEGNSYEAILSLATSLSETAENGINHIQMVEGILKVFRSKARKIYESTKRSSDEVRQAA